MVLLPALTVSVVLIVDAVS